MRKRLAADSLFTGEDEVFAFRRAISRLTEMQSEEYLERSGARRASVGVVGGVADLANPLQMRASPMTAPVHSVNAKQARTA